MVVARRMFVWRLASMVPFVGLLAQRAAPRVVPALKFVRYSAGSKVGKWVGWLETTAGRVVGFVDKSGRRFMMESRGSVRHAPEWTAPSVPPTP